MKADTLLQELTSDENGMATCTLDLPFGEYYVTDLQAPEGFVSSDEVLEFVAEYQGQETKIVSLQAVKKNEPTTAEFTKVDLTTAGICCRVSGTGDKDCFLTGRKEE